MPYEYHRPTGRSASRYGFTEDLVPAEEVLAATLWEDLHNPGIDRLIDVETAPLRRENEVLHDLLKDEIRDRIEREVRAEFASGASAESDRSARRHLRAV